MDTTVITHPTPKASPQRSARVAGGLYLLNIFGGIFAIGVVPAALLVPGDAAATLGNIESAELLYRLSLAAHMVVLATNAPLAAILYDLFRVVDRRLASLMASLLLVGTAVEAATLLGQFAPLTMLEGARYGTDAFSAAQVQVLAEMPVAMRTIAYDLSAVFFGCYGITLGYLVFASTFIPRIFGVLLVTGGSCYLIHSFATVLAPEVAASLVPFILLPSLVGEGSFCLRLMLRGVDVPRWQALAADR